MTIDEALQKVILPKYKERIRRSIMLNFREEGRPEKWSPSFRTNISNRSKFDNKSRQGKTLFDTGKLRNSIKVVADGYTLTAGSSIKYAKIHDQGGVINQSVTVREHQRNISQAFGKPFTPRKVTVKQHNRQISITIPQRQFLMIQEDDKNYFLTIASQAITQIQFGG